MCVISNIRCTGAAVSAAICGYLVTRKIQAYAEVLKKASENFESRDKQKEQDGQENSKSAKSATEHEAIVSTESSIARHISAHMCLPCT